MADLEDLVARAWPEAQQRGKDMVASLGWWSALKLTVTDVLGVAWLWGVRDTIQVMMKTEKEKKMRSRGYDLTNEHYTIVHDTLPKIADLALAYLVSDLPRDSYFDGWAGMMIAAGDTSSWGDDAIGCALVDVGEKYEKFVTAQAYRVYGDCRPDKPTRTITSAEARGALLRAGSLLVSANNQLVAEEMVQQAITVGVEKYLEAAAKLKTLGIEVPK